ncbi:MAG: hypothetical protein ABFS19_08125 [Thermodesulfobacteriota bacterium]
MELKDQWTVEAAVKVLEHKTVDAKLWAEAVEWLILYGPPKIRKLLLQSSDTATTECFPELKATAYSLDGQPCYTVAEVAQTLGISEEKARETIARKQDEHQVPHFIDEDDTVKLQ